MLAAFKPYLPVINYVVNYEFYKMVLCENKAKPVLKCNGKCHLAKEIKAAKDQNNQTKLPMPRLDLSKLPIAILETPTVFKALFLKAKNVNNYANPNCISSTDCLSIITPPPNKI